MTATAPENETLDHDPCGIQTHSLTKRYGDLTALDDLSLDLAPGQVVGLLGPNGCGKTTLFKVLAGVMADYEGEVRVAGHAPGPDAKALTSYLPDAAYLPGEQRVTYCLEYFADFFPDFDRARAEEVIQRFGLAPDQRVKEMSRGMREKLQLGLAMARRASVVLLDEPISGIDPASRDLVLETVIGGASEDSLVVIASHLVHDIEPVIDTVVMMRGGRVELQGPADDLRAEHGTSIDQLFRKVYA